MFEMRLFHAQRVTKIDWETAKITVTTKTLALEAFKFLTREEQWNDVELVDLAFLRLESLTFFFDFK